MQIAGIKTKFSITSDAWKSNSNHAYLGVTLHFTDANFNLVDRVIGLRYLDQPHNADYIYQVLQEVLVEWKVQDKVSPF